MSTYLNSERHFRLYELFLAQIVTNWPELTIFDPDSSNLSVDTLATRIRMCRDNLVKNRWRSDKINMEKFDKIANDIAVSTLAVPGKVAVGPMDKIKAHALQPHKVGSTKYESTTAKIELAPIVVNNPSLQVVQALVVLHHNQVLTSPSMIVTKDLGVIDLLEKLSQIHDVAIQRDGDNFTIL